MLLSPIPSVPSDKLEGPEFRFCYSPTSTRLGINVVFWMCGLFVALYTALLTPGVWGQGIGMWLPHLLFSSLFSSLFSFFLFFFTKVVWNGKR